MCWLLGWHDSVAPGPETSDQEQLDYILPFQRRVASWGPEWQIAVTKRGHICMLPMGARKDDIICTLYGCVFPLVLRSKGSNYILIGAGYVSGYMSFEAVREMKDGKREETVFTIV